jgi:uncharacterized protein (UPF0332 family)
VTKAPFERALVRKGKSALRVARLALNAGDNDSAVSRAYYAMFDFAQAALLHAGVTEDKLPRTHSGIIDAFRRHAVQSGLIGAEDVSVAGLLPLQVPHRERLDQICHRPVGAQPAQQIDNLVQARFR